VSGITFLQNSAPIPGTDVALHELIKCYNCQNQGHYASACPQENREQVGVQLLQMSHGTTTDDVEEVYFSEFSFLNIKAKPDDFNFHQSDTSCDIIPNSWILLDSQSTVSVFKNREFLLNIRPSNSTLRVHTNGGVQTSSLQGTVKNFGDIWLNTDSLANILSMAAVRKVCRITMDTSVEAAMIVHRKDGSIMKFKEYKSGLYYYDAGKHKAATSNTSNTNEDYIFLITVAGSKESFTRREIEAADKARALYRKIGPPSEQDFNQILDDNLIRNCPVTSNDARRALHIYGPAIGTLKGRTVKRQNRGIQNYQPILIPSPIIEKYKDIRLFMDIFWVNGNPFFHTISQWIKFRTVAPIENRLKKTLLMETLAVVNMYEAGGFNVTRLQAAQEFKCIADDVLPINLNVADADDHGQDVESSIRTIKERTRCTV
jgi:hypothetical protein